MKPDFYTGLEAIVLRQLSKNNVNPDTTLVIAPAIIADVVKTFGGSMIYLKNRSKERAAAKHQRILADFDGTNYLEVCQKHRITQAWFKKLLRRGIDNEEVE